MHDAPFPGSAGASPAMHFESTTRSFLIHAGGAPAFPGRTYLKWILILLEANYAPGIHMSLEKDLV